LSSSRRCDSEICAGAKKYQRYAVYRPVALLLQRPTRGSGFALALVANRIVCGDGVLATGDSFKLNVQTIPIPATGRGGNLFGTADGNTSGRYAITGP
jgi:hypothetical protein